MPGPRAGRKRRGLVAALVWLATLACATLPGARPIGSVAAEPADAARALDTSCQVTAHVRVEPGAIMLGERADVAIEVAADCPGERPPLHVALVLDGSGSVEPERSATMKDAALQFIDGLDAITNPATRLGVVEFPALRTCRLTNDVDLIKDCVLRVRTEGESRIEDGIREGRRMLVLGRGAAPGEESVRREALILLSDGYNSSGCARMIEEAELAKRDGIQVIAGCLDRDCDRQCMAPAASGPRQFIRVDGPSDLGPRLEALAADLLAPGLEALSVTAEVPTKTGFVVGSARPEPERERVQGRDVLDWTEQFPPTTRFSYAFQIRPLAPGSHPVSTGASGRIVDELGQALEFAIAPPSITVLEPWPVATSDLTPTPLATPTATSTPRPSGTVEPTATPHPPTPVPLPAFLPLTLRSVCRGVGAGLDVVIAIDLSDSMTRSRSPMGRTHLEAIADALRRVVAALELEPDGGAPGDRVAVIGFHGQVVPVLGLSRDRRAADDALARVPDLDLETVTDFVPPIIRGRAILAGAEDVGNAPVLVLVSDGAPYDPEAGITAPLPGDPVLDPILEHARDARRAGITIVALLVGGRYDTGAVGPWLFERIATSRDTYRHSQDGEDVAALFWSICLRSVWPGRSAGHINGLSR